MSGGFQSFDAELARPCAEAGVRFGVANGRPVFLIRRDVLAALAGPDRFDIAFGRDRDICDKVRIRRCADGFRPEPVIRGHATDVIRFHLPHVAHIPAARRVPAACPFERSGRNLFVTVPAWARFCPEGHWAGREPASVIRPGRWRR